MGACVSDDEGVRAGGMESKCNAVFADFAEALCRTNETPSENRDFLIKKARVHRYQKKI